MPQDPCRFRVVVPAAGRSRRMQVPAASHAAVPKQYLQLRGRSVLEWSLTPFLSHAACAGVVVVVAADDERWDALPLASNAKVRAVHGGQERSDSVLAGINSLRGECVDSDWVLVHDAARPCLDHVDLQRLLDTLCDDAVGGLLAAPVVDSLKRADAAQRIKVTVARENLWRALTPQMFRYGVLVRALSAAALRGVTITDELQAVEMLGLQPRLVAGSSDNIKITLPEDIVRAERLLSTLHPRDKNT